MNKNIAAFFDIDGTLYRNSLLVDHFKKLIKFGILDSSIWHSHVKNDFEEWSRRQGNYDTYLFEVAELYRKNLIGIDKVNINFTANQVIKLEGDKVYKYTRQQIEWHRKEGHKIIFISGSPNFLVDKMAKKYDAFDYCGSIYHFDENDCFNGDITPMWDTTSKNKTIHEMVTKYDIDLSKSYAYGDTHGDLSMLLQVGNPIAINPSKELLNSINLDNTLKEITKIIIERKDVIYQFNAGTNIINY